MQFEDVELKDARKCSIGFQVLLLVTWLMYLRLHCTNLVNLEAWNCLRDCYRYIYMCTINIAHCHQDSNHC